MYSGFGQAGLGGQSFAGAYARVVALVKLFFQLVQLVRTERGPVAPELRLLGSAATAHALHVVFAAVYADADAAAAARSVAYKNATLQVPSSTRETTNGR